MHNTKLSQLLPADLMVGVCDQDWLLTDWVFKPDAWTVAFLRGLKKLEKPSAYSYWEVGVGSGLVSFFVHLWRPKARIYYSDFDPRCESLAHLNLQRYGSRRLDPEYESLCGSWDLVKSGAFQPPIVDVLLGCIPQAPLPVAYDLKENDNMSHYYDPKKYPESKLHHLGLGLTEALLSRGRNVLKPKGRAVLNLGGRPGLPVLKKMFKQNGYKPKVIHEEVVLQHRGTCLQPFVDLEARGTEFEFFGDSQAKTRISAKDAEAARVRTKSRKFQVYHKIYVIEGTMI